MALKDLLKKIQTPPSVKPVGDAKVNKKKVAFIVIVAVLFIGAAIVIALQVGKQPKVKKMGGSPNDDIATVRLETQQSVATTPTTPQGAAQGTPPIVNNPPTSAPPSPSSPSAPIPESLPRETAKDTTAVPLTLPAGSTSAQPSPLNNREQQNVKSSRSDDGEQIARTPIKAEIYKQEEGDPSKRHDTKKKQIVVLESDDEAEHPTEPKRRIKQQSTRKATKSIPDDEGVTVEKVFVMK